MEFMATVLYAYGGLHRSAIRFLQRLTNAVDPATCLLSRSGFQIALRQHVAIAVQRGNADIMIRDADRKWEEITGRRCSLQRYRRIRESLAERECNQPRLQPQHRPSHRNRQGAALMGGQEDSSVGLDDNPSAADAYPGILYNASSAEDLVNAPTPQAASIAGPPAPAWPNRDAASTPLLVPLGAHAHTAAALQSTDTGLPRNQLHCSDLSSPYTVESYLLEEGTNRDSQSVHRPDGLGPESAVYYSAQTAVDTLLWAHLSERPQGTYGNGSLHANDTCGEQTNIPIPLTPATASLDGINPLAAQGTHIIADMTNTSCCLVQPSAQATNDDISSDNKHETHARRVQAENCLISANGVHTLLTTMEVHGDQPAETQPGVSQTVLTQLTNTDKDASELVIENSRMYGISARDGDVEMKVGDDMRNQRMES